MKHTIVACDIKGCTSDTHEEANERVLPMIFITEQNEGRSTPAHISNNVKIDICPDCEQYMLKHREFITAAGAMGNNRYWFVSRETHDD